MLWLLTLPFRLFFGIVFGLLALPFALLAIPFALLLLPFLLLLASCASAPAGGFAFGSMGHSSDHSHTDTVSGPVAPGGELRVVAEGTRRQQQRQVRVRERGEDVVPVHEAADGRAAATAHLDAAPGQRDPRALRGEHARERVRIGQGRQTQQPPESGAA